MKQVADDVLTRYESIHQEDWNAIKNEIKDRLRQHIFDLIKRSPMILPIIMEI